MLGAMSHATAQIKNQKSLPKMLPGSVCVQWKRCGRSGCKCMTGALHGPYYYRFWREDGRLCKAYVKRSDVQVIRAACAAEREDRRQQRLLLALGRHAWREIMGLLRERWSNG